MMTAVKNSMRGNIATHSKRLKIIKELRLMRRTDFNSTLFRSCVSECERCNDNIGKFKASLQTTSGRIIRNDGDTQYTCLHGS